jgi:release factor glutamine methyltransferase
LSRTSVASSPVAADPGCATVADALRLPGLDPTDSRILLQHVLHASHAELIAHSERPLDERERAQFGSLAARRRHGEPIAYLVGLREFYGRTFAVDAAVLIPRPETELLIDLALARIPKDQRASILDLGTGSGIVAITLALECPLSEVCAVDVSQSALAVATRNAHALGANRVRLLEGSWYQPVRGRRFDLIVSNPPYVTDGDPHLAQGDLRFEPGQALKGGGDGLNSIREIVAAAPAYLVDGGWLLFEHGYDQGPSCRGLLAAAGFSEIFTAEDLGVLPRVGGGRRIGAEIARPLAGAATA